MKLTAFFLFLLLVGAMAMSKRAIGISDGTIISNNVTESSSGTPDGSTTEQPSNGCSGSSGNLLIQVFELLGTVISQLLQPVLQLLGLKSVGDLLLLVVQVVTELLSAVGNISLTGLLTQSPTVVLHGYPALITLVGILVNVLQVPLGLVGALLAGVLALVSKLL